MKKYLIILLIGIVTVFVATGAMALTFTMYEEAVNEDGAISIGATPYDFGSKSWSTTVISAGNHTLISYVDIEIDELVNGFFNEYGEAHGSLASGQSWEIDEPGFTFGNIYSNFLAGSLDNSNGVPSSAPEDVSMALGWDFTLLSGETANLSFTLSSIAPLSGFYLSQTDPDSGAEIYFSSTKQITSGGCTNNCPIPEPGTVILLGSGIAGLFFFGKKRLSNK